MSTRYYDPAIGRFINADALTTTGQGLMGNNMFAYCNNNPVNFRDDTGTRMDYVSFDCGAPTAFPSASTIAYIATKSIHTDTKENIRKKLITQAIDSWDYCVAVYNSPAVQRPIGTYSFIDGIMTITAGVELLIYPYPTLLDEIKGLGMIFMGFKDVIDGIKARHPSV